MDKDEKMKVYKMVFASVISNTANNVDFKKSFESDDFQEETDSVLEFASNLAIEAAGYAAANENNILSNINMAEKYLSKHKK